MDDRWFGLGDRGRYAALLFPMAHEFTQQEADRHNELTQTGWDIVNGELFIHDSAVRGTPNWLGRRKLKKAISCFEQALKINPDGYSSMWALGKIYQRLGNHETSLDWFGRAHELNPTQPDVAREAGLAALDCGESELAVRYCNAAVKIAPDDAGLICNLSLAHILAGDDSAAMQCATNASDRAPDDGICKTVLQFVEDVATGKRSRPKTLQDVFPN